MDSMFGVAQTYSVELSCTSMFGGVRVYSSGVTLRKPYGCTLEKGHAGSLCVLYVWSCQGHLVLEVSQVYSMFGVAWPTSARVE